MSATLASLRWSVRAIGPRVALLLLSQLVALTLAGGLAKRVIDAVVEKLSVSPDARAIAFAVLAVAALSWHAPLRHALCPVSLAALRRQPLANASFAWHRLPWALPLAWPWALVLWLAHPDRPLVVAAGWLAGAVGALGLASSPSRRAGVSWVVLPVAVACLVDRHDTLAWAVLPGLVALATWPLARAVRAGSERWSPVTGLAIGTAGTPFGALLGLDRTALGTSLHWLRPLWLPLAGVLYVAVTVGNGNCRGDCPTTAGVIVTTLGLGLVAATLGALRRAHGSRLLVPDRTVPTRLRLASLFVASIVPLAPIALVLAGLARRALPLTQAAAVTLAVLWVQLGDPMRSPAPGPALWLLAVPTSIAWLPPGTRLAASAVVLLALVLLVDRRGAALRRTLSSGALRARTP